MIYIWAILVGCFVLLILFFIALIAFEAHKRRHAMEMRGYRLPGDPNCDPRSANEP
jgi:hypothetical protein